MRIQAEHYEPGGREFESLRARHLIKQQVSEGFESLFYLLLYPFFFQFSRKQQVTCDLEYLVKNQVLCQCHVLCDGNLSIALQWIV